MRDQIISLETRMAFQEKMIDDLNKIVYKQQMQLDYMAERFPGILEKLQVLENGENINAAGEDAPPPHY
ncbi:MAG: SlyX family protein [Colwellia sp.]|nr:SlyX family protein [Colwellia sp.]